MAVLARPDHIVEAAFFSNDDGLVWSNLSDDIELQEGVRAGARRQNVFDDVAPATFSATFDNTSGKYNNDRSDSPFFGQVNLDVPIRFRLRWPNVPGTTGNMLGDTQSTGSDATVFVADQGSIDTDTASPPAGQTSDIIWTTGVLDQTGVTLFTDSNPTRVPADQPVYVKPNTSYSARIQVKGDTAATGISFAVKGRIRWFDIAGNLISDSDSASATTLTTAYQAVTVTATSPGNVHSARMGIVTQTVVAPATRSITYDGGDVQTQAWGTKKTITIPGTVDAGDFLNVFVRANNTSATISAPAGWTFKTSWSDSKGKTSWWYKVATASDISRKYTFSTDIKCGFQVMLTTWTGVHQTTLIHQFSTATESVYRTTHTTPSVTTTLASCLIVSAVFDVSSTTTSWSAPVGENVRAVAYRPGGNSPTGIVTDPASQVAAGTYGSNVFTSNASSRFASMATFALAPASGTGPGSVTVQLGAWEFVAGSLGTWQQGGHWENEFTGLVDSWNESFSGDLVTTTVNATDRQKVLNTITVGSAVSESIRSAAPVAYYKLDESGTGTNSVQEAANSSDTVQPTLTQKTFGTVSDPSTAIQWGSGKGPGLDGSAALLLKPTDRNNGIALTGVLSNPLVRKNSVSLVTFWKSSVSDTGAKVLAWLQDPTNGKSPRGYIQIGATPGTSVIAEASIVSEGTSLRVTATKTGQYFDGKTHCLVSTASIMGGQLIVTLFIDGAQVAQATGATSIAQFPHLSVVGLGSEPNASFVGDGTYSHFAIYDWALDADTVADISTAGFTAFFGDTVDQRIMRLANWTGQGNLTVDASPTILARHMPDDQTLLEAFQQAARSEGGTVYIGGSGDIVFRSRVDKEMISSPLITVTASAVDPGAFSKITDDELLVNKAVVKRLGTGVATTVSDPVSVDDHGVHEKDVDTILSTHDDALNYATYLQAFYSEPQARCTQVTIRPLLLQNWSSVIQVDIWSMLLITGMPSTEASSTLSLFIEGWEIDIDQDNWTMVFDTSTAIPFAILNDSVRGICGQAVVAW